MEELRLFAVAGVTTPPVELSRKVEEQLYSCCLTLPLPPQFLIFSQGQWPEEKSSITLDIFLDSENIGKMTEEARCFTWDSTGLSGRKAGEKMQLKVKVIGLSKPSPELTKATTAKKIAATKKTAAAKKTAKSPPTQAQKETRDKKEKCVSDTLEKPEKCSEKVERGSENLKLSPDLEKAEPGDDVIENTPPVPKKGKPGRKKKSLTLVKSVLEAVDSRKASPTPAEVKKTKQTQLNFAGVRKTSPVVGAAQKCSDAAEKDKKGSASDKNVVLVDVDETEEKEPRARKAVPQTTTDVMLVTEDDRCEAQVMADMHSPLPRKPAKQKRLRSDEGDGTPDGPTPKKRGTRMRALTSDPSTPKSGRAKTALGDSSFSENVVKAPQNTGMVTHSDGRLTRCIELSARAPRPSARWGHTMLLTQPRCAMLIGGQGDRQQLSKDSIWSLHTETRKWSSQDIQSENQKPEYRMGHTATYDPTLRCIYIFGGSKNSRWFHDVHVFDLDEKKWTLAKVNGKAPTRAYHTATLHRHELWIFGGVYPRPDPNPDGCSNDIHIFSPVMQGWYSPIVQGEKPIPRSGHSATLIKDQLVMFGGWDAPFCYNDLFILDLTTVDWCKPDVKGTPPKPRSWHASCALSNERILIHGGYDGDNALEDSFIFDLGALSWSRLVIPNAPKARAGHAAVSLPYSHQNQEEDEVLVFGGGDNDGEFFDDLLSFAIPFNAVVEVE
ncbi:uncharacterized protein [Littorina saxatilis]|uniref:uncharacterized protein isoform X2 n=1 Tax=Littorina saxatilis TaxID=31220 RepID=UPI0038B62133